MASALSLALFGLLAIFLVFISLLGLKNMSICLYSSTYSNLYIHHSLFRLLHTHTRRPPESCRYSRINHFEEAENYIFYVLMALVLQATTHTHTQTHTHTHAEHYTCTPSIHTGASSLLSIWTSWIQPGKKWPTKRLQKAKITMSLSLQSTGWTQ